MQFDTIVGNPPYQVNKSAAVINVWKDFVKVTNKLCSKYVSIIHPGSWVVPTSQLVKVRDEMLESNLEKFDLYPVSNEVFDNTGILGGITFTFYNKEHCNSTKGYVKNQYKDVYSSDKLFLTNEFEDEIYTKIVLKFRGKPNLLHRKIGPTGLGYDKEKHLHLANFNKEELRDPIAIYANMGYGKTSNQNRWFYIERSNLDSIPDEFLQTRKVMIGNVGDPFDINSKNCSMYNRNPEIVSKITAGPQTFLVPDKDDLYELSLLASLIATKTARFLMSLSQKDRFVRGFENIPDYTLFIEDMKDPRYNNKKFENKLGLLDDEYFYTKFNISKECQEFIENHLVSKEFSVVQN